MLATRLRRLFGRESPDSDFDDDVEMHLDLLTERFIERGMAPVEAATAARRQFGNTTLLQERRREMLTLPGLEHLWRVIRHGVRQLRRSPSFTATAVVSLALGIGLTTSVFTLLDQLVLRLLPVAEPERLVMIWSSGSSLGDIRGPRASSFPLCQDFQRLATAFESVFCRYPSDAALTIDNTTESVRAELVSGNYFQALGVGPALGRMLSADADDRIDGGHPVLVVSYRYWLDRFGGDPGVVGRKVLVNKQPMEVVGVANAGFNGVDAAVAPQVWLSVRMKALMTPGENGLTDRHYYFVQLFGRLKPGVDGRIGARVVTAPFPTVPRSRRQGPGSRKCLAIDRAQFLKRTVLIEPAANGYSEMRQQYARSLAVLMGMAGLILLIACSNVAGLLVARALARQREMVVRLSIGASRATLIGQLLVESLLLSLAGAAVGLVLSVAATRALLGMLPATGALLLLHGGPDLRILLFSVGVSALTGLLFGLLPALQATKLDLSQRAQSVNGWWNRLASFGQPPQGAGDGAGGDLVPAPGRSRALRAHTSQPEAHRPGLAGHRQSRHVSARSRQERLHHSGAAKVLRRAAGRSPSIARRARGRLHLGAAAAGVGTRLEHARRGACRAGRRRHASRQQHRLAGLLARDGSVPSSRGENSTIAIASGSPSWKNGQLSPSSTALSPSASSVRRRAVGRHFGVGDRKDELGVRIVGVVGDSLLAGPRTGIEPQVFFSFLQANFPVTSTFYVRTEMAPGSLVPALRRAVANLDSTMPIHDLKTLDRQLDDTLSAERLIASLAVVFAGLATVMAALGLYGVMSFAVARRTKEIGLRTALGASPGSVLWLVMREVFGLLGAGMLVAIPCALLLSRYIAAQLFGVAPTDVWTSTAAGATLAAVAVAAGLLPARRARTIDPAIALRHE